MSHEHEGCCHSGACHTHSHSESGCASHYNHDHMLDCHEEDHAVKFIDLANDAWMEVLKDKMRKEIDKQSGAQMEALAKIVVNANNQYWKGRQDKERNVAAYRHALRDHFGGK